MPWLVLDNKDHYDDTNTVHVWTAKLTKRIWVVTARRMATSTRPGEQRQYAPGWKAKEIVHIYSEYWRTGIVHPACSDKQSCHPASPPFLLGWLRSMRNHANCYSSYGEDLCFFFISTERALSSSSKQSREEKEKNIARFYWYMMGHNDWASEFVCVALCDR